MRDIRPQPKKSGMSAPRPIPTGEGPTPRRPQMTGERVPVASIQVPTAKQPTRGDTFNRRSLAPALRRPHLGGRERTVVAVLLALAVLTAMLAAIIFLPRAEINLILRTAPLLVDERLTIDAQASAADSVIPGSSFFREVAIAGTTAVTGTEVVGEKARGVVQIVNRTVEEQQIRERSRLVTADGQLFYMLRAVTVPPAEGGSLSRVSVEVEAADAGLQGNIEPQRLDFAALDDASQQLVYAENPAALTGGSGETVAVVQTEDIEGARDDAAEMARSQVEPGIREELPAGWVILDESWSVDLDPFTTDADAGARQAALGWDGRASVRVMTLSSADLEAHLRQALEARLDDNFMLFPGPITYSKQLESVDWDAGRAEIAVRVTHTTIPRLTLETLREKIVGRSTAEATQYLQGLPGVRSASINLSPFWATTIPRIQRRIIIDFHPERQP